MSSNYQVIVKQNLKAIFADDLEERAEAMAAVWNGQFLSFNAFGMPCRMSPEGIFLQEQPQIGPVGILLTLYALHAIVEPIRVEPFKAFKEIPNSIPYAGAFSNHTEKVLVPKADRIIEHRQLIIDRLDGREAPAATGGDDALVVHPLPKIALLYIFYAADEDFPASATCLYSNNANAFMPVDGLADVGEYTSKAILDLIG